MKQGMRKQIKKEYFLAAIVLLAVIKQVIVSNIPLLAYETQMHDDALMFRMADSILNGEWLGGYTVNTLVKGCFFPLLSAFIHVLGLSWMGTMTFIYTIACMIFIYALCPLIQRKSLLLLVYTAVLFNPVTYAAWTFQRFYRNGITMAQVLIVFACVLIIYMRRNEAVRKSVFWAILGGFTLWSLWNTREDGIWIMPFMIVATAVTIVLIIVKKKSKKETIQHIIVVLLPLLMLSGGNFCVRSVNYLCYGIFSYNEINDSSFSDAMKAIYSVKPEEKIERVSVTREKVERMYKVSPTLKSVEPFLESSMDAWDYNDQAPGDGEVQDGWFFWSLRDAVSNTGYYCDAKTADEFYSKVAVEIETAFEEGSTIIEKQKTMPSALMSPWREGYFSKIVETMQKITDYVLHYDEVETRAEYSNQSTADGIRSFEGLTNDRALYPEDRNSYIRGWYVSFKENVAYVAITDADQNIIQKAVLKVSEDVAGYLGEKKVPFAEKCRFEEVIPKSDYTGKMYLTSFTKEDKVIDMIPLSRETMGEKTDNYEYNFDSLQLSNIDIREGYVRPYVDRMNAIGKIYKVTGVGSFILSVVAYLYSGVSLIKKKEKEKTVTVMLILSGLFLSTIVLFGGVAYNEIASCDSIRYMYLSGAYPMVLAFEGLAIIYALELLLEHRKRS